MAGFEVVVRPVVFPNIRPAPAQPVPPADDPTQGFATISGNGAQILGVSYSYSSSASSNTHSETERREDEARVYQKTDDGKINKNNFVDVRAVNRIKEKGPPERKGNKDPSYNFAQGPKGGDDPYFNYTSNAGIRFYAPIEEKDNIEIRRRAIVTKRGEESGGGE
jgi:hypothetical protein